MAKRRQGFATLPSKTLRAICAKGGRSAHAQGKAYEWTREEARAAGRKGGSVSRGGRGRLPEPQAVNAVREEPR
jgi:general stress protein YciG